MKQHRGIIAMLKVSIILVIGALLLGYSVYSVSSESKQYWESVGPSWDILLNPCDYNICE
jgi:hypothetical protein